MTGRRAYVAAVLALIAGAGGLPARADVADALSDLKAGRFLEAAAELQSVVDRSPGYAYGHFLLGHCKLKTKDIAGAEYEFRRALSLDASRADYYLGFGLALNADGKWPFTIRAASEGLLRTSDPRTRIARPMGLFIGKVRGKFTISGVWPVRLFWIFRPKSWAEL